MAKTKEIPLEEGPVAGQTQSADTAPAAPVAEESTSELIAILKAEGKIILTDKTREGVMKKFCDLKAAAFDVGLCAGCVDRDRDNDVYAIRVDIIK